MPEQSTFMSFNHSDIVMYHLMDYHLTQIFFIPIHV